MDITILGFPGCFYFGLCNVKRKESEKGEREREERGGGGWNRWIFFLGDRIHGSQNIYRIINIYYSAARWVHLEKWHHLYLTLKFSNDFSTLYITTHNFCFFEKNQDSNFAIYKIILMWKLSTCLDSWYSLKSKLAQTSSSLYHIPPEMWCFEMNFRTYLSIIVNNTQRKILRQYILPTRPKYSRLWNKSTDRLNGRRLGSLEV